MNLHRISSHSLERLAFGVALIAATACGGSDNGGNNGGITGIPEGAAVVEMPGNAFSPDNVVIKVNGVVAFDFPGAEHDVTFSAKAGAPANIPVTSGKVVTRTFSTAGVFPYECRVHPGMIGQVTVNQ